MHLRFYGSTEKKNEALVLKVWINNITNDLCVINQTFLNIIILLTKYLHLNYSLALKCSPLAGKRWKIHVDAVFPRGHLRLRLEPEGCQRN